MSGGSIDSATTKQTTLPPETLETLQRETFDYFHQLSHLWIDLHGIQDGYMRGKCIDYFENSRRATFVQRRYAIHNPGQFEDYGENCWGITASDGPGWVTRRVKCRDRSFFDYHRVSRRTHRRQADTGSRKRRPHRRPEGRHGQRLVRGPASGTENIYKIYAESFKDSGHLKAIVAQAQEIVRQALAGGA